MTDRGAKDIRVAPISPADAAAIVKRVHYSGTVVRNSNLHLGVFLGGRLEGAMQFGPSLDKRKIQGLVSGTGWNGFIEINRMAFSDRLPRNSESRALGVALRMIRKQYPHIEWVVSFADGSQCGDGTIYRAAGFVLTSIKRNTSIWASGSERVNRTTVTHGKACKTGAASMKAYREAGFSPIPGFQLRYIYFINPAARERLAVPVIPFNRIEEMGACMYRGEKIMRTKDQDAGDHPALGGETPTRALQDIA